jgi:hypothetical protein
MFLQYWLLVELVVSWLPDEESDVVEPDPPPHATNRSAPANATTARRYGLIPHLQAVIASLATPVSGAWSQVGHRMVRRAANRATRRGHGVAAPVPA